MKFHSRSSPDSLFALIFRSHLHTLLSYNPHHLRLNFDSASHSRLHRISARRVESPANWPLIAGKARARIREMKLHARIYTHIMNISRARPNFSAKRNEAYIRGRSYIWSYCRSVYARNGSFQWHTHTHVVAIFHARLWCVAARRVYDYALQRYARTVNRYIGLLCSVSLSLDVERERDVFEKNSFYRWLNLRELFVIYSVLWVASE